MPETTLRIITIAASVISLVAIFFSVRAMRRERPMSKARPLVSCGIVAAVTVGYLFITHAQLNLLTALIVVVLGLLVGWGEGRSTRIHYKGNQVVGKQSGFYLILWGLAYVLTLFLAQTQIAALHAGGILAMVLGMSVGLGSSLTLFRRIGSLRPQPVYMAGWQPQPYVAAPAQTQTYYQAPVQANGYRQAVPTGTARVGSPHARAGQLYCPKCGNPSQDGKFCTRCGALLPVMPTS